MKPPGTAPLVPPIVVTETATLPAALAGVVNVSDVALFTVTLPAGMVVPPMVTEVLATTKLVPVIVTAVPPAVGPDVGLIDVTVGGAT